MHRTDNILPSIILGYFSLSCRKLNGLFLHMDFVLNRFIKEKDEVESLMGFLFVLNCRFIKNKDEVEKIRRTFAGLYSLDEVILC